MGWWTLGQWLRTAPAFCLQTDPATQIQEKLDKQHPFSLDLTADGLCRGLPRPVFRLNPEEAKALDISSKCKCATYIRAGASLHRSQFTGQPHQYQRWLFTATSPVTEVKSESELHSFLLSQNPTRYLDSIVIAYIPSEKDMKVYEEIAVKALTEDQTAAILLSEGKTHVRFVAVRDVELADRLQLLPKDYLGETEEDLVLYRYFNPDSLYLPFTIEDYRPADQILSQTTGYLRHHFTYPSIIRQLRLKLLRQKYVFHRNSTSQPDYSSLRREYQPFLSREISKVAAEIAKVKLLIRPLTCLKDMQMVLFPMLLEILRTKRPILVLSAKEKEPIEEVKRLNFRQVAKKYVGKVIAVAAKPSFLAHSHIKNINLRHQSDTELRLYLFSDAEYPTVSHQYRLVPSPTTTDEDISTWVQACLDGKETPYWECDALKLEEKILFEGNWKEVNSLSEAWVYVGHQTPRHITKLENLYRLPLGVEIPYKRLTEGLYRVREGVWERFLVE